MSPISSLRKFDSYVNMNHECINPVLGEPKHCKFIITENYSCILFQREPYDKS